MKKIIHIDMDAFYAQAEEQENPKLKGKPVAVGWDGPRSVLTTANYKAREYGVGSAMSSRLAKKLCPSLIFITPNFKLYKKISTKIREIFKEYTDLIEPLSLDEAFLDITHNKKGIPSATWVAQAIKKDIFKQTGLTASAGVAQNKFLAKVASDMNKPNGLTVITPDLAEKFLEELPIEKFFGVGKVTAKKMKSLDIETGKDLKEMSLEYLIEKFGKSGDWYYRVVRNQDNRPVEAFRERKSLGAERTFHSDLKDEDEILNSLEKIIIDLSKRIQKTKAYGKTLTLKIKFEDFTQISRSTSFAKFLNTKEAIKKEAFSLLDKSPKEKGIRLLGLSVSNFKRKEKTKGQLTLKF